MASPFKYFRKHQKLMLAILGVLAMFGFVILPVIMQGMGSGTVVNPMVATTQKYGDLAESRLRYLRQQRNLVLQFLAIVRDTVREAQGNFLYAHQMMEQIGPLEDESIINAWLLAKRATDLGLVVDDKTINQFLADVTQGKLGSEGIRGILRSMNDVAVPYLFDSLRQELLALRARELLSMGLSATTPGQRWEYFQRMNRKVTIESAGLAVEQFLSQVTEEPSERELVAFFDEHKMTLADPLSPEPGFAEPKRVSIEYLKAEHAQFVDRVEVTEEEIAQFYEENKDRLYVREPLPVGQTPQAQPPETQSGRENSVPPKLPSTPGAPSQPGDLGGGPAAPPPKTAEEASPGPAGAMGPSMGPESPPELPKESADESEAGTGPPTEHATEPHPQPDGVTQPPETHDAADGEEASGNPDQSGQKPAGQEKPTEFPLEGGAHLAQPTVFRLATYQTAETDRAQSAPAGQSGDSSSGAPSPGGTSAEADASPPPLPTGGTPKPKASSEPEAAAAGPALAPSASAQQPQDGSSPEIPTTLQASADDAPDQQAATAPAADAAGLMPETQRADQPAGQSGQPAPAAGRQDAGGTEKDTGQTAPSYIPLAEVREEIRKIIARRKAPEEIRRLLNNLQTKLSTYREQKILFDVSSDKQKSSQGLKPPERPSFEQLARDSGLTAGKLTLVSEYEVQETEIGRSSSIHGGSFTEMVFDRLPEFEPGISQDSESNQYLFWKVEQVERKIPELADQGVRERVLRTWKTLRARQLAVEEAARLAEQARRAGKPLREVFAGDARLRVAESQPFSWLTAGAMPTFWSMQPPKLSEVAGVDHPGDAFMQAVFQLQPGEVGTAMNHPQTVAYVFRVTESNPPEEVLWQQFVSASYFSYYPALLRDQYAMQQALIEQIKADAGFRWDPNWLREQVQSRR